MPRMSGPRTFQRLGSWSRAGVPARVKRFSCAAVCKNHNTTSSNGVPHTVTPLEKLISNSIRATGPISVAEYMQLCLSHPTEGYYMKQRCDGTDMFGVQGDFITSPEISQVFGELVAIWLLSQWLQPRDDAPRKRKIRLVELGPGRGTLMDDILRTFHNWPHAKAALSSVHLVETSAIMSAQQKETLSRWFHNIQKFTIHEYTSIEDIPPGLDDEFTMVVAHEFFDALPGHILEKTSDGFREVLVDILHSSRDLSTDKKPGVSIPSPPSSFQFVLAPTATPRSDLLGSLSPRFAQLPVGTRLEVSRVGWRTAWEIGRLISRTVNNDDDVHSGAEELKGQRGAGLVIDYGNDHVFPSSFRAFKNHRLVDVFETPGKCDLTMNVDFALLKEALQGTATTHGPLQQSEFLLRMGIRERLAALVKQATSEDRRHEIHRAGNRLMDQAGQGMGAVYRVLGITSLPPGGKPKDQVWPFVDISKS